MNTKKQDNSYIICLHINSVNSQLIQVFLTRYIVCYQRFVNTFQYII